MAKPDCFGRGAETQTRISRGDLSCNFHLVVETPQPTLVAGMKWLLGTFTGRFDRRHHLFGHLFSGRYKSMIVDGSGHGYVRTLVKGSPRVGPGYCRILVR